MNGGKGGRKGGNKVKEGRNGGGREEGGGRREKRKKGEPAKAMTSPRENLITIFTSTRQNLTILPLPTPLINTMYGFQRTYERG